jgi:hypothetical protein
MSILKTKKTNVLYLLPRIDGPDCYDLQLVWHFSRGRRLGEHDHAVRDARVVDKRRNRRKRYADRCERRSREGMCVGRELTR